MLDKLGRNGDADMGVGLPLIPMARPDSGAKTESGETLLGLSRADRLKGGPNAKIKKKNRQNIENKIFPRKEFILMKCENLPSIGESSGRLFSRSPSRCGKTILS